MTTTYSKGFISKQEVLNRLKNGVLAAGGGFAIAALSSYRISQELVHEPKLGDVVKVSAIFALVAGVIWAFMPAAAGAPEEHLEDVRDAITEPLNVFIVRMMDTQVRLQEAASDIERRYANRSVNSSGFGRSYWDNYTNTSPRESFVQSSDRGGFVDPWNSSYTRGWNKAKSSSTPSSVFDDDCMPPDDDDISDEELQDFYKDLESKYVV